MLYFEYYVDLLGEQLKPKAVDTQILKLRHSPRSVGKTANLNAAAVF